MTEAEELLEKYRLGKCTLEELRLLQKWFHHLGEEERSDLTEADLINAKNIFKQYADSLTHKHRSVFSWSRIAAAASILLFLSVGTYFVLHAHRSASQQISYVNDVKPGSNSATLTLGNGQKIVLNTKPNGQLAVQGKMVVTKTANGQLQYQQSVSADNEVMFNTITTNRKEQYKVILADGTSVWLNAASSIKYPTTFTGNSREVSITGEAYFEVAHNAAKPFRVSSQGQIVEVLGTHFNVNSYADEPAAKTTLLEGSVRVTANNNIKIIAPGEQTVLMGGQLSVSEANTEEAVAWKNGYFRFNKEAIGSIMRKLSRWYDIDVRFEGGMPDDEFTGTISRFTNISEVLKALEYYKTVHFKVEGRRVTVSK